MSGRKPKYCALDRFSVFADSFDQALSFCTGCPELDNIEPHRIEQFLLLRLGALHARQQSHHVDIQQCRKKRHVHVGQNPFVEQQLGASGCHGRDGVLGDLAAFVIGPVVEDRTKIVSPSAYCQDGGKHSEITDLLFGIQWCLPLMG